MPERKPSLWQQFLGDVQTFFDDYLQPYGAAVGAACALVVVVAMQFSSPTETANRVASQNYSTGHGEIRVLNLQDGTVVTLAPESKLRVSYTAQRRQVALLRGEGLFSVTKNPQRPFVVETGQTHVTVLGTEFTVKRHADQVSVAVREGKVKVAQADGINPDSQLLSKQQILLPGEGVNASLNGEVGEVTAVNIDTIGVWKDGRLVYTNARLKEVIDDANKYYEGRIVFASQEVGELGISISFTTDNIDQMLDNLSQALPISLNRDLPGTVLLEKLPSQ